MLRPLKRSRLTFATHRRHRYLHSSFTQWRRTRDASAEVYIPRHANRPRRLSIDALFRFSFGRSGLVCVGVFMDVIMGRMTGGTGRGRESWARFFMV